MHIREDILAMLGLGRDDPVLRLFNIKEEREYSVVVNTGRGTMSLDSVSLVVLLDNELKKVGSNSSHLMVRGINAHEVSLHPQGGQRPA